MPSRHSVLLACLLVGAPVLGACGEEGPAPPPATTGEPVPATSTRAPATSAAREAAPPTPTLAPPTSVAASAPVTLPALGLDRHRIAVGADRACLITIDGGVACFDTQAAPWIAHRIASLSGATSIAVGGWGTCIVRTDRSVLCTHGPLSAGAAAQRVESLNDAEAVAVERDALCARDAAGGVRCFGHLPGDRGDERPFEVALPAPATQIAAADTGLCALLEDGRLFCYGDVGNSTAYFGSQTTPQVVPVERAASFSVSADHLCVRTLVAGDVLCAGAIGDWFYEDVDFEDDERGPVSQLELPVDDFSPVDGVEAALELASTADHACARTEEHRVVCWGTSYRDGRSEGFAGRRAAALRGVDELVAGGDAHRGVTCAVSSERAVCFATNRALGHGTPAEGALPICDGDAPEEGCTELRVAPRAAATPTTGPSALSAATMPTGPAAPSAAIVCVVHDPSGTPLNVRVDASTHAAVAGTLDEGTEVTMDETRGRFRHIVTPISGWAWSDALSCP